MANTDLNELNPMIWPDSARRSDFGELTIGGVGVRALVEQYGSPLFIFDEEHVRNRARNYVKAFNTVEVPTDVYYALNYLVLVHQKECSHGQHRLK